jgi:hypothetical protein
MSYIYQAILAVSVVFIVWEVFTERDAKAQLVAAMVLIPFLLRLFMIA